MTTMTLDTLHTAQQLEKLSVIKQADFDQRLIKLEHNVDQRLIKLEHGVDLKIGDIRLDLQKLDTKIDKLEVKFDSKFDSIQHEIKYMKWAFGILIILLVIPSLKSLLGF